MPIGKRFEENNEDVMDEKLTEESDEYRIFTIRKSRTF